MKRLWWILPLALAAMAAPGWLLLRMPGQVRPGLYDVEDLVYDLPSFPTVDISLAGNEDRSYPPPMAGMDLAERISWLLPKPGDGKADETIEFANGLIIARTTGIRQAAIRGILAAQRPRDRLLIAPCSHGSAIRKTLSKLLPADRK